MPLPIATARSVALRKLAAERFGPISGAEMNVLDRSASTEDWLPASGTSSEMVRAEFLRWLVADKDAAEHIDPLGLRVDRATIRGDLNLDYCRIPFPLRLTNCVFQGAVSLQWLEVSTLDLRGCAAEKEITASNLVARGNVNLRRLCAGSTVNLAGSQIGGNVIFPEAVLRETGVAFNAQSARISGSLLLGERFSSAGKILIALAQIGGNLNCAGARLTADDIALDAYGATIAGSVFLRDGFFSSGALHFTLMKTGLDFDCSAAERFGLLACENMRVEGRMILTSLAHPEQFELKLNGATVGEFHDDRDSWPTQGRLHIDGLVYRDLVLHGQASQDRIRTHELGDWQVLDPDLRIAWIRLQPTSEMGGAQPWMQLAQLLEADGDPGGARQVVYAYHRQQAKEQGRLVRPLTWVYDRIEEEPLRISLPILVFWALGSLVFWRAARMRAMMPLKGDVRGELMDPDAPPRGLHPFSPVIYALENVLPVVKLGQDSDWAPDPTAGEGTWLPENGRLKEWFGRKAWTRWIARLNYRRLVVARWSLILLGWAMALILAAAIAGIFRQ